MSYRWRSVRSSTGASDLVCRPPSSWTSLEYSTPHPETCLQFVAWMSIFKGVCLMKGSKEYWTLRLVVSSAVLVDSLLEYWTPYVESSLQFLHHAKEWRARSSTVPVPVPRYLSGSPRGRLARRVSEHSSTSEPAVAATIRRLDGFRPPAGGASPTAAAVRCCSGTRPSWAGVPATAAPPGKTSCSARRRTLFPPVDVIAPSSSQQDVRRSSAARLSNQSN